MKPQHCQGPRRAQCEISEKQVYKIYASQQIVLDSHRCRQVVFTMIMRSNPSCACEYPEICVPVVPFVALHVAITKHDVMEDLLSGDIIFHEHAG